MQAFLTVHFVLLLLQAAPSSTTGAAGETWKQAEAARASGQLRESEMLYREALAGREREDGPDHPGLVAILSGLGEVLHQMERDVEAQTVFRRVLSIQERSTPDSHAAIGITLNNLAEVYRSRERFVTAEPLFRRALHELETALGDHHFWIARVLNNLGALRADTGYYEESAKLFRRALALSEAHQPESAEVAAILSNLSATAIERGKFREAERYLLRAMRIQSSVLAADHPASIAVARQYAFVLRHTGRTTQAERIEAGIAAFRP